MSNASKIVTYVRFVFSSSYLDAAAIPSRHDPEKSIENYVRMCEEKLRQTYPDAEIDIVDADQAGDSAHTLVYVQRDDQTVEDDQEAEVVEALYQQIYAGFEWVADKRLIRVDELTDHHTAVPRSAVRWACMHGLIEGAKKHDGYWDFPLSSLAELNQHIEIVDGEKLIASSARKRKVCYLEDVREVALGQLPEKDEFLLITRNSFGVSLLKPDTSSILVSRMDAQAHVTIEHFMDVEKWPYAEWTYPRYVTALIEQAKKRNVKSKCQTVARNDTEIIDGVSFHFAETVQTYTTIQDLLNTVLNTLSEIIELAEILLAGGRDVSDAIYQRNEDRFCQEILKPLLEEMGFQHVRYTHGTTESGRDFYFEYPTPFEDPIYFGLQAKKGNISGRADSTISKILEQVARAFENSFTKKAGNLNTEVYISIMIIAISGEFTDRAVQVIRSKMSKYPFPTGSVYFWDKHTIRELSSQYYRRSNK